MAVGASPGPPVTHPQRPGGFAALRRQLAATGISPAATLVVLEATGNYWAALAATPHTAGYRGSVINPLQAHHFAKAQLRRAKTDPLDARNLAQLAAALQPAVWTPPPAVYHDAARRAPGQRLTARDVLVTMRQQARNQRHALLQWPVVVASVRDHLDGVIALFDARIADLEGEIAAWLLVSTMNFTLCATPAAATAGLPTGEDGIGADVPHLGVERARPGAHRPWRTEPTAHRAVHGHTGSGAAQPGAQGFLRPLARGGQAAQGGALRGAAQAVALGGGVGDEAAAVSVESSNPRSRTVCCLTTNTVSPGRSGRSAAYPARHQ